METKSCAICGEEKPEGAFAKRTGRKGRRGTCRSCQRKRKRGRLIESAAEPAHPMAAIVSAEGLPAGDKTAAEREEGESLPPPRKRKRRRRRKSQRKSPLLTHAPVPGTRLPYRPIKPFKGPFKFDSRLLNDKGTGMIQLRGRRESGKRWHTEIDKDIAVRMVDEGAAGILHPRLIHKLYSKSDFRLLILQRDNYTCHYCGKFGDTIDHVFPKSKGGLSTPANCVCACSECNLRKADKLSFDPDDL